MENETGNKPFDIGGDLDFKSTVEKQPTFEIGGDLDFRPAKLEGDQGDPTQGGIDTDDSGSNINLPEGETPPVVDPPQEGEGQPTERGGEQTPSIVEIDDEAVSKYISSKLGKDIKFEDLNVLTKEPEQEDEYILKLKEWRNKTGRPIEDWIEYTKDYSTLEAEEVLRTHIKREYPNLTNEQIELELDNWMILETDDDDVQTVKELKLAKELPKIRQQLQEQALALGNADSKLITPELEKTFNLAQEIVKSNELAQQEEIKNQEVINSTITEMNDLPINLGDINLSYKLDQNGKENTLKQLNSAERWYNPDGTLNHKLMLEDAAKVANFDSIIKTVYEQGVSKGIDQTLKGAVNSTIGSPQNPEQTTTKKGIVIHGEEDLLGGSRLSFKK